MSITVTLSPTDEARLSEEASSNGVAIEELVGRLLRNYIHGEPATSAEKARDTIRRWQLETGTETHPAVSAHDLFTRWEAEDADMTDDEAGADDQLWEEFQHSIDDERRNLGMRTVFATQ